MDVHILLSLVLSQSVPLSICSSFNLFSAKPFFEMVSIVAWWVVEGLENKKTGRISVWPHSIKLASVSPVNLFLSRLWFSADRAACVSGLRVFSICLRRPSGPPDAGGRPAACGRSSAEACPWASCGPSWSRRSRAASGAGWRPGGGWGAVTCSWTRICRSVGGERVFVCAGVNVCLRPGSAVFKCARECTRDIG